MVLPVQYATPVVSDHSFQVTGSGEYMRRENYRTLETAGVECFCNRVARQRQQYSFRPHAHINGRILAVNIEYIWWCWFLNQTGATTKLIHRCQLQDKWSRLIPKIGCEVAMVSNYPNGWRKKRDKTYFWHWPPSSASRQSFFPYNDGLTICKIIHRTRWWKFEVIKVYRSRHIYVFVMYYI